MILAIDSSSLVASVAIADEETIVAEYTVNLNKTHSQTLLPMIKELFDMTGLGKDCIEAVAVTEGPGSFTGLRIGAATAKGFTLALDLPVIGLSTLLIMANNYNYCDKLVCPIMDARREQVYTGIFDCTGDSPRQLLPDCAIAIEELIETLARYEQEVVFVGDGIPAFREILDKRLAVKHYYGKQNFNRQQASAMIPLAFEKLKKGEIVSSDLFVPKYFRMSQAERERAQECS